MSSSYWYLKGFPIKEISDVETYTVYMTYDLHGQWDWNNPNAADGCDGGGCLRSHVNVTETSIALSMITKAGVPNNKIFAGVASYGRSFKMEDPSCHGPECKFTGPESGARPGECTQTAGYIAEAEIKNWLESSGDNITTYWDKDSRSYISFSQDGDWVAYLDQEERNERLWSWWFDGHFAGTVLWAVDLTEFVSQNPDGTRIEPPKAINCTRSFDSLDDLESATGIDDYCTNIYLLQALSGNLTATLDAYRDKLDNNYDKKFGWYKEAIRKSATLSLSHFSRVNASNYFDCIIDQDGTNHTDLGCFSTTGAYGSVYWIARDKPRFEEDLFAVTVISADWLTYEAYCEEEHSHSTGSYWHVGYYGVPHLKDDFKTSNPKDKISKRLSKITDFHSNFGFTAFLANETMYMGDMSDAVDGASLAVLMISASVTSMSQVADAGQDYEDEKIKNIILLFLTGVLFLIPGLEEGAAALELAEIASILRLVGTAGDVAMSAYDVVQAKDNAPAAVFGALLGGLGALNMVKAPESFGIAAKARRGMPSGQVEALGPEVKGGLAQIDKLVKACF